MWNSDQYDAKLCRSAAYLLWLVFEQRLQRFDHYPIYTIKTNWRNAEFIAIELKLVFSIEIPL